MTGHLLPIDQLAQTAVRGLKLRSGHSIAADVLGVLPIEEPAFVLAGPQIADGYSWYQIASVREPHGEECNHLPPAPSLKCREWLGWAAAAASGTAWLKPRVIDCPTARDTSAYPTIRPAERLACVGDDEWVLRAYAAPLAGGRGCLPTWLTNPRWLDGSCNFFFPQPVASEMDEDTRLQAFLDPTLGICQSVEGSPCSYDGLVGVWIQMVGHLDDPRARECVAAPIEEYSDAPLPDPERVVFDCRLRLVVTEITESTAP